MNQPDAAQPGEFYMGQGVFASIDRDGIVRLRKHNADSAMYFDLGGVSILAAEAEAFRKRSLKK